MRKASTFAALIIVLSIFIIGLSSGITKNSRDGGGKDLVEELYFQAVKQNDNLKSIEDAIESFHRKKDDALEKYAGFTYYNNRYYTDAKTNATQISDGTLRQKTNDLINKSETAYHARLAEWSNIIATMKEKEKTRIEIIMIMQTKTMTNIGVTKTEMKAAFQYHQCKRQLKNQYLRQHPMKVGQELLLIQTMW